MKEEGIDELPDNEGERPLDRDTDLFVRHKKRPAMGARVRKYLRSCHNRTLANVKLS
jgi:hypothetical protein